jgi:hypothetical protein
VSLDERLKADLERDADGIVIDVERNLGAVEARARNGRSMGSPLLLVAAAAIAIAIALRFGLAAPQSGGGPSPSPFGSIASPAPEQSGLPSYDAIAGTYRVTLDPSNPTIAQNKLGGSWTMRLAADGEIFLSPPATFGSGPNGLSGLAFNLSGDRFRSNIFYNDFCSSIGTYTWSIQGNTLSFARVDDTCPIRQALLSTTAWQVGP